LSGLAAQRLLRSKQLIPAKAAQRIVSSLALAARSREPLMVLGDNPLR
jgi:hypothetical protein